MRILRAARVFPLLAIVVATACDVRITVVEVHPAPAADKATAR